MLKPAIVGLVSVGVLVAPVEATQLHCGNADPDNPKAYTSPPVLKSARDLVSYLDEEYPRSLKQRGIGGRAEVAFFIDTLGVVVNARVEVSTGVAELDSAAVRVARRVRFYPAYLDRSPICKWVRYPLVFRPASDLVDGPNTSLSTGGWYAEDAEEAVVLRRDDSGRRQRSTAHGARERLRAVGHPGLRLRGRR